jgi:hypothetical protein
MLIADVVTLARYRRDEIIINQSEELALAGRIKFCFAE